MEAWGSITPVCKQNRSYPDASSLAASFANGGGGWSRANLHGHLLAVLLEAPLVQDLPRLDVGVEQLLPSCGRQHVHAALTVHQQHLVGGERPAALGRGHIETHVGVLQRRLL